MHGREIHRKLAEKGIRKLKRFPEVEKLILYGSVARGDYRPSSDIDIAFICFDIFRDLPLDLIGFPIGLSERIGCGLRGLQERSGIKFQVPIYWNSELEEGIELFSGKKSPPDYLDKVGLVVCDYSKRYDPFAVKPLRIVPLRPTLTTLVFPTTPSTPPST